MRTLEAFQPNSPVNDTLGIQPSESRSKRQIERGRGTNGGTGTRRGENDGQDGQPGQNGGRGGAGGRGGNGGGAGGRGGNGGGAGGRGGSGTESRRQSKTANERIAYGGGRRLPNGGYEGYGRWGDFYGGGYIDSEGAYGWGGRTRDGGGGGGRGHGGGAGGRGGTGGRAGGRGGSGTENRRQSKKANERITYGGGRRLPNGGYEGYGRWGDFYGGGYIDSEGAHGWGGRTRDGGGGGGGWVMEVVGDGDGEEDEEDEEEVVEEEEGEEEVVGEEGRGGGGGRGGSGGRGGGGEWSSDWLSY
ncbi:hypothetical protein BSL78_06097 [Apostichopus japonicus]|uniref:Uncharacterized protein n=1 Tax=Stichopus japonicus TaxID=307972 RepID=A0A2G8L9W6_STIJA|nr:hypothetical protein BSL78_06097 [Apostichopus japonicus]